MFAELTRLPQPSRRRGKSRNGDKLFFNYRRGRGYLLYALFDYDSQANTVRVEPYTHIHIRSTT